MSSSKRSERRAAKKVAASYALAASAWQIVSGRLFSPAGAGGEALPGAQAQTLGNWLFIAVTTLLLYVLVRHYLRIAARRETEALLRQREQELWQIIDLVPHFIFAKDASGRFILANRAVADAYGTTPQQLVGRTDADFNESEEEQLRFRKDDQEVISSGVPRHIPEETVTDSQGRVRILQTTKIPFTRAGSELPALLGVSIDITERRRTEAALRQSELLFRRIFESPVFGILVWDTDGRVHDANDAFLNMVGYTREDLAGGRVNWSDMTPPEYHAVDHTAFLELQAQGFCTPFEKEFIHKNGTRVPVLLGSSLTGGPGSRGISFILDTTERRRAESERELFSSLGFELAAADTLEKVAATVRKAASAHWDPEVFLFAVRRPGQARYRLLLGSDHVTETLLERLASFAGDARQQVEPGLDSSSGMMYAFMYTGQRVQGMIAVRPGAPGQPASEEPRFLQRIADAAAPALERCRLELRALAFLQLGERLSAANTPEEAARIIVSVANEVVGWDCSLLYLYSEKEHKAYPLVRMDTIDGNRRDIPTPFTEIEPRGNMKRVFTEQRGFLILRPDPPASAEEEFELIGNLKPSASILWVPIRTPSGIIGALSVQSYTPNAYGEEDLETLQALAGHCGGALERTRAQKTLREREERYRQAITEAGAVPYQLDYLTRTYVFVGEGIGRITGYCAEEFTVERMRAMVLEVIPRGEATGLSPREASEKIRQGAIREWRADIRIQTRTGDIRWLSDTSVQLLDEHGIPIGSLGILQDITERKRAEEAMRESEERYRRTITGAGAVPYQRDYSDGHRFAFIGEGIEQITGYSPEELTCELWNSMIEEIVMLGEGAGLPVQEAVRRTREGEIREWRCDVRIRTRSGEQRWLSDTSIQLLDESGRAVGSLGILIDVTERKKVEQALRESEERYALAAQAANDALWDWDLTSNSLYLGPRWAAMLGMRPDQISSRPEEWFGRVHPEDVDQLRSLIAAQQAGKGSPHFEVEYRMLHEDGTYRWILCRGLVVRDAGGTPCRLTGSQTDVTERRIFQEQLVHDAFHDTLTGLPNRALLIDRLEHVISRTRRRGDCSYAVIFIDLDRFKIINDSLGHLAGDMVLKTVARRLEECIRPGDTVARFAGDEFTILLEDLTNPSDSQVVAQRIQHAVSRPMSLDGQTVYTTVSMGIALGSSAYQTPDELLRDADNALYRAKASGKARYEIFDPSMHARAVAMLELETDLRRAIEQEELVLHYQPIVSLQTGRIAGFEALVRWLHPQRGMIPPAAFIPLAEETGLIVPMGWWIAAEACRQLRAWNAASPHNGLPLLMSINLSARQFTADGLTRRLEQIVRESGLSPSAVAFEITETVLMENPEAVAPQLEHLRSLGFHLHLDDFGTGYSSLSYLHRFPINTLKIDRSFVSRMRDTGKETDITRAIIQLAHNLGMGVTAEGVETADQLSRLRDMNCGCVQGNLISRPVPGDKAEVLLAEIKLREPDAPR